MSGIEDYDCVVCDVWGEM